MYIDHQMNDAKSRDDWFANSKGLIARGSVSRTLRHRRDIKTCQLAELQTIVYAVTVRLIFFGLEKENKKEDGNGHAFSFAFSRGARNSSGRRAKRGH